MTGNDHLRGRKVDKTGRSTGRLASSKARQHQRPDGPFVWVTKEMLESPAWAALSGSGLKALFRIALEHIGHGGTLNGELPVTHRNLRDAGISAGNVLPTIAEIEALGFVRRTSAGRTTWGEDKGAPSTYRLTWIGDCHNAAPTNDWRKLKTVEAANLAAMEARKAVEAQRLKVREGADTPPPIARKAVSARR